MVGGGGERAGGDATDASRRRGAGRKGPAYPGSRRPRDLGSVEALLGSGASPSVRGSERLTPPALRATEPRRAPTPSPRPALGERPHQGTGPAGEPARDPTPTVLEGRKDETAHTPRRSGPSVWKVSLSVERFPKSNWLGGRLLRRVPLVRYCCGLWPRPHSQNL